MDIECSICDGTGFRVDEDTNTAYPCVCRHQRILARRTKALSKRLPKRYRNVSLESTFMHDARARNPAVMRGFEAYLRRIDENLEAGRGLWIFGGVGTGKTELAMLVSKTAMDRGHSVIRYTLPELLATIRGTFNDDSASTYLSLVDSLCTVELLHIDDVGAEQTSPWVLEQLYTIVNARYEEQKSIVLTTNLEDREAMATQIGDRTASRLAEMCDVLPFHGTDFRVEGDDLVATDRRTG
jgi:DNA replication protein DnaC